MSIAAFFNAVVTQLKNASYSAMATTLAKGFLLGFGYSAYMALGGNHFDLGTTIKDFMDPNWLYGFLDNAFDAGIFGVIAILTKSGFDKKTEQALNNLKQKEISETQTS